MSRYHQSRSFKVIEMGVNRKPVYDFLLVFMFLSSIVFEITIYLLVETLRFTPFLSVSSHVKPFQIVL